MDDALEEVRYPFDNLVEFFAAGHWAALDGLHLTLGWVFILLLARRCLRAHAAPRHFRLSVLYFALALFSNPAYTIGGLGISDLCGVLAILTMGFSMGARAPAMRNASPVVLALFGVFVISVLHNFIVLMIYPALNEGPGTIATRVAVNAKIIVLAINLLIVGHTLRRGIGAHFLTMAVVAAGTFGACAYLLQGLVLLSGTIPYGTFIDAGYVGVPSFGSVSIERGHFGKFMAPLFPFFLFALLAYGWRWRFAVFVLVSCINFSASGLAFFFTSALVAAWIFRRRVMRSGVALFGLLLLGGGLATFIVAYWEVFEGVWMKVYEIAFLGDESAGGGRSFGTFMQYVEAYPFGIGYSGSTLRTAPGLPEINAAHFAFVTQFSALALPLALAYLALVWRTVRLANRRGQWRLLGRAMSVGVITSVVIFGADILWFVPTIWLAFEMVWAHQRAARRAPAAELQETVPAAPLPT